LEKLKEKIRYKKENKKPEDHNRFKETIKFGDTVHQPPVLSVLPKVTRKYASSEINNKTSLLRVRTVFIDIVSEFLS
jgi:hypothetical protein